MINVKGTVRLVPPSGMRRRRDEPCLADKGGLAGGGDSGRRRRRPERMSVRSFFTKSARTA